MFRALVVRFRFDHSAVSRATMELQIKTAMQMRDQGHALKQKALDLVAEAELKVGMRALALERTALGGASITCRTKLSQHIFCQTNSTMWIAG